MKQVSFLSHVILEEGIFVDSSKSWNALASNANIWSLLGLVGYYQRFIKGFSKMTKPVTELSRRTSSSGCQPVKLVSRS
jgi:hypothetical protein